VEAISRTGPVTLESSGNHCIPCPVMSDSSGGVGLVCGIKRGIDQRPFKIRTVSNRRADVNNPSGESSRGVRDLYPAFRDAPIDGASQSKTEGRILGRE
jgi:hypothetical protein